MPEKELKVYRREIKYVITKSQALLLESDLEKMLISDGHSSKEGYRVKSLYFDTYGNNDFNAKADGIENRRKIRLRTYDEDSDFCKLELKQKYNSNQLKESLVLRREQAIRIIDGDYSVLLDAENKELAVKLYSYLTMLCYRPSVLIEYNRRAFTYPLSDTRVTIDSGLNSTKSNFNLFSKDICYTPFLNDHAVLEVKYSGQNIGFINDAIKKYGITQSSYSKYEKMMLI